MIAYAVLLYLVWFVKAPWWLYVPTVTGAVFKTIQFLMEVYEAGKENK